LKFAKYSQFFFNQANNAQTVGESPLDRSSHAAKPNQTCDYMYKNTL